MSKILNHPLKSLCLLLFAVVVVVGGCQSSDMESNDETAEQANDETGKGSEEGNAADDNGPAPLDSEVDLKIAYPTQGASMLPLWVAKDLGFFEKYGVNAELVYIAGTPKVQEALNGGGIEAGLLGVDAVGKSNAAGHDSVIISSAAEKVAMYVYGTENLNKDTLKDDLKGKTVITAAEGTLYDYLAQEFVDATGLENDDVDYLNLGGEGDRTAAFANGEGEALVISPPTSFKLENMGYHKIFDFGDLDILMSGLGMKTDYYEDHPKVAKALVAAMVEANHAILTNKEDTVDVLMDWTGISDRDIAEKTYEAHLPVIPDSPVVPDKAVEFFLDRSDSEDVRQMEVNDLVDDSISVELDESGWVERIMNSN